MSRLYVMDTDRQIDRYFLTEIRIIEENKLLPAILRYHLHDDLIEIDRWANH